MHPTRIYRSGLTFALAGIVLSSSYFTSCVVCSAEDNEGTSPQVMVAGRRIVLDDGSKRFPKHSGSYPRRDDESEKRGNIHDEVEYYILNSEKPVLYVSNFLNHSVASSLIALCVDGGRFVRSPIRGTTNSATGDGLYDQDPTRTRVQQHEIRTSESCSMVPAAIYRNSAQVQAMFAQDPMPPNVAKVKEEVDLSWIIAERASQLLGVDPWTVEPLQLVRYTTPDAEYKLHHDHGGYYGKNTEVRPWTMLVFLNDVAEGGHTSFPKLDLEVVPRFGDAIVWSNVKRHILDDGSLLLAVDEDMVHVGKPPAREGVEKYAMNVWFGQQSIDTRINEGVWS